MEEVHVTPRHGVSEIKFLKYGDVVEVPAFFGAKYTVPMSGHYYISSSFIQYLGSSEKWRSAFYRCSLSGRRSPRKLRRLNKLMKKHAMAHEVARRMAG